MMAAASKIPQGGQIPLEQKKIATVNTSTGMTEVLDKEWMTEINFLPYSPPLFTPYLSDDDPTSTTVPNKETLDPMWKESIQMLDDDLNWLLLLDYQKFWCQVFHDTSLHKSLDSYLRLSPRPYDETTHIPLEVRDLMMSVHRRVFLVFLRMSTHKENTKNFLSPDFFGKVIYDHFLFDIPKLMDICVLYGSSNKPLVTRMMENIFKRQPKYEQDWKVTVKVILDAFTEKSVRVLGEDAGKGAIKLNMSNRLTPSDFSEIVLFLGDSCRTLCSFVSIYPQACHALQAARFIENAVQFYESTIMKLQEIWHTLKSKLTSQQYIKERLRMLKRDLVWLVHELLQVCFISPQPADSSGIRSKTSLDDFISMVSEITSEKNFLREYKKQFDLSRDVRQVQNAHPEVPETHFDYVLSALMEDGSSAAPSAVSGDHPHPRLPAPSAQAASIDDEGILHSLISQVKDLLPHLEEGFIKICLQEFNNNPETVINKILEDSLPPHLSNADFTTTLKEQTTPLPAAAESSTKGSRGVTKSLLNQRECVFDNDEFDVFNRPADVDLSRVHIGKKSDSTSIASLLDDKSHYEDTRQRYKAYEIETPWDWVGEDQAAKLEALEEDGELHPGVVAKMIPGASVALGYDLLYDDEYDDTYDSHNVGAVDDATDEQFTIKRLNQKGLFAKRFTDASDEKEAPHQTPSSNREKESTLDFVKNYMSKDPFLKKNERGVSEDDHRGKKQKHNAEGRTIRDDSKVWREDPRMTRSDDNESWEKDLMRRTRNEEVWRNYEGKSRREDIWTGKSDGKDSKSDHKSWRNDSKSLEGARSDSSHRKTQHDLAVLSRESKVTSVSSLDLPPSHSAGKVSPDHTHLVENGDAKIPPKQSSRGPSHSTTKTKGDPKPSERDRQIKDRNKGNRANHNRRAMADKKRKGGMI